ncbi:MAG TPA: amino acid ABC transporter substrate-binding protein [Candidatus Nanopelagicaceae bacterium]
MKNTTSGLGASRYSSHRRRKILWTAAGSALLLGVTTGIAGTSASAATVKPVTIGISVSLSGDFSGDGLATEQGYKVWASVQNSHGGILGRPIKLKFLSDASSPTQVVTNYQKFITSDKVDFVLGPYSTKLTKPASLIASRYKYVMLEGIGGGPSVFSRGLKNVFDVSASATYQLVTFAKWLVATQKPQPVAYATMDDPFIQPMVDFARSYLNAHGFTDALYKVYPAETSDFSPIASSIAATNAKIAILGTMPPDGYAMIQDFIQAKYNPQMLIEASGPDQGSEFVKAVGATNTEGIMVPNTWIAASKNFQNAEMVKTYIKMYGGTADSISADVPEAFSAGQVLAQAVNHLKSLSNPKLQAYLHSGASFVTAQGPVKFIADGENGGATPYVFQWQKGKYVPVLPLKGADKVSPILVNRPDWGTTPGA